MAENGREGKGWWHRCRDCSLTKKGSTPVRWSVMLALTPTLFSSCYTITFLFPFLPEMVLHYGYKEEEKGYYAGIIASGMFAGRIFGSYFWGWLSDHYGRRPVLLVNMLLITITNVAFGFSTSIIWAFSLRFINGLVNGIVGTVKTILYEISDSSNQAVGMSIISFCWGSGIVLGPLISGHLSSPAVKYPNVFPSDGLFGKFPFLLPSLICALCSLVSIPIVWFTLPETLQLKRVVLQVDVTSQKCNHDNTLIAKSQTSINEPEVERTSQDQSAYAPCLASTESLDYMDDDPDSDDYYRAYGLGHLAASADNITMTTPVRIKSRSRSSLAGSRASIPGSKAGVDLMPLKNSNHSEAVTANSCSHEDIEVKKKGKSKTHCCHLASWNFCVLLRRREVQIIISVYSLFSFAVIGFEEIFSVWASTDLKFGGLAFTSAELGNAIGISSFPVMVIGVFLYPILESRIGAKLTFASCNMYLICATILLPAVRFVPSHMPQLLWTIIMISVGIMKCCGTLCMSSIALFINNSVEPQMAGSINGLAMTMAAFFRSMAPLAGGSIFAWSIIDGQKLGFPFDLNLIFIIFGFTFLVSNILCALAPSSLNRQSKKL